MFQATCSQCGGVAEVPFQPRGDKPVYCRDCFSPRQTAHRVSTEGEAVTASLLNCGRIVTASTLSTEELLDGFDHVETRPEPGGVHAEGDRYGQTRLGPDELPICISVMPSFIRKCQQFAEAGHTSR